MTPLERAARALCANQRMLFLRDPANPSPPRQVVAIEPDEWDDLSEGQQAEYRRVARLVIAAVREPSDNALLALRTQIQSVSDREDEVWAKVFDLVLAEGK